DVTLDPDTAHPELVLFEDRKRVRRGNTWQNRPDKPERFMCWKRVVRESINRKGTIALSPNDGLWVLRLFGNKYEACTDPPVSLPL
ncbi:hypothetical protein Z043_126291, partial [Scleropages formosus]